MNRQLEQTIDSSAAFYTGLLDLMVKWGKCQIIPNPFISEYVMLKSWYYYQPEDTRFPDCPYWLFRGGN